VRESSHNQNGRHCREVVTMIVVRITMNVLPEKQKELVQTLLSMVESMEKEAGCLSYALFCNMEDKNLLNLLEEWQTRKDLDQHLPKIRNVRRFAGNQEPPDRTAWHPYLHHPSIGGDGSRSYRPGERIRRVHNDRSSFPQIDISAYRAVDFSKNRDGTDEKVLLQARLYPN
jgi:quinol monooxygenase YgiN